MSFAELEIGDDYVGADDDDIDLIIGDEYVGATRRRGRARANPRAMAPRAPYSRAPSGNPSALYVKERAYDKGRRYPMGWDSNTFTGGTPVAAGATLVMAQRPQVPFRVERLIFTHNAPDFLITQFLIGKDSQLMNGSPLPASAFAPDAVDAYLGLDTAVVGQDVSLTVQNISAAPSRLIGMMSGPALDK